MSTPSAGLHVRPSQVLGHKKIWIAPILWPRSEAVAVAAVTGRAHDRDDLLDRGWVGRVLLALIPRGRPRWCPAWCRRRTAVARDVQQHRFHESSLGGIDDVAIQITPVQTGAPPLIHRTLLVSAQCETGGVGSGMPVAVAEQVSAVAYPLPVHAYTGHGDAAAPLTALGNAGARSRRLGPG